MKAKQAIRYLLWPYLILAYFVSLFLGLLIWMAVVGALGVDLDAPGYHPFPDFMGALAASFFICLICTLIAPSAKRIVGIAAGFLNVLLVILSFCSDRPLDWRAATFLLQVILAAAIGTGLALWVYSRIVSKFNQGCDIPATD